ncbi:unnamed protein product [Peniophora sp. CBMAI 1063]|nr:unnamed protein product [Peniophora sp. CBMAI 1063]
MWCTRWFVPLLLLPLPSAPPYFLLVFLTSLVVHARPCFYCILLLSALFVSSCHWSPVALDEPLSRTLIAENANASTFGDALALSLDAMHVSVPQTELPAIIRLHDRCWCDPALTTLFEPFDILSWELYSVARAALDVRKHLESHENPAAAANASEVARTHESGLNRKRGFLSLFAPFTHRRRRADVPQHPEQSDVQQAEAAGTLDSRRYSVEPHPWELDMRPYGYPLILDLTWWRRRQRVTPVDQVHREVVQAPHV